MEGRDPYRGEAGELCSACTTVSRGRCPRCNLPLCALHGVPPELLCTACAEYELRRVTAAGRRTAGVAAAVTLGTAATAALLLQVFTGGGGRYSGGGDPLVESETPYLVVVFATIAIVAVGVALVVGSFAARGLARRRVREERELPVAEREAIERRFRERADRSRAAKPVG